MRTREKLAMAKKLQALNTAITTVINLLDTFVKANNCAIDELSIKPATKAKNTQVKKTAKKTTKKGK